MSEAIHRQGNDKIRQLSTAYERSLGERIPKEVVANLGFESKQALIETLFIDTIGNNAPHSLTPSEVSDAYDKKEYLPACLCYRNVENMDGPIYGGEFLTRRLDPQYGLAGYQSFFHAMGQDMRSKVYMDNIDHAAKVAGELPDFCASVNVSGSMMERPDFNNRLRQAQSDNDLDEQMHLEILEYIPGLSDVHLEKLQQAVDDGIHLCLDDCGEGNSAQLLQDCKKNGLPVHTLKIDSRISVSPLDAQVREIDAWIQNAEDVHVQSLVFEGDKDALLTPKVLDTIREARHKVGEKELLWLIEGPVFQD